MLMKLIQSLFPEGQRKVMVSLIAILVGTGLDKVGGGLSENMVTVLLGAVGLFTAGNIVENLRASLGGTSVGKFIERITPGDTGFDKTVAAGVQMATIQPIPVDQGSMNLDSAMQRIYGDLDGIVGNSNKRFDEMDKKLAIQADNVAKLVKFINGLTAKTRPAPAVPQDDE